MASEKLGLSLGPRGSVYLAVGFLVQVLGAFLAEPSSRGIDNAFLIRILGLACATISVPIALRFCHRTMLKWSETLSRFISCDGGNATSLFRADLRFFRGSRSMVVAGLCFALAVVPLIYFSIITKRYPSISVPAASWTLLVAFVAEFFAGMGLYALVKSGIAIRRLGHLPGCRIQIDRHQFGVLSTGTMLFKCWSAAAIVWLFFVIPIVADVLVKNLPVTGLLHVPIVTLLAVPTIVIIVASFVICQLPLHERMVEAKGVEILRVQSMLDKLALN